MRELRSSLLPTGFNVNESELERESLIDSANQMRKCTNAGNANLCVPMRVIL
jgi:hypothetical protein